MSKEILLKQRKHFAYILFLCLYSLSSCKQNNNPPFNQIKAEINIWDNVNTDEIQFLETIPMIYIAGSGYDAGFQHGTMLSQLIQENVRIMYEVVYDTTTFEGHYKYMWSLSQAREMEKHIPKIFREEMKGVAEGSGVGYDDILLFNTYDDLLHLTSCSSISAAVCKKNNTLFHARNLDYPIDVLSDKNVVFHYRKQKFISVGFPGYIGALTSTNYRGITLSSHTARVNENKTGIPSGILYRIIIEKSAKVSDVERILNSHQRTIGNNLMVSSCRENKTVVFEITPDTVVAVEGTEFSVATNHFVSETMLNLSPPFEFSERRYTDLQNFFEQRNNIQINDVLDVMSGFDGNLFDWSSVANKGTVQSVVFLPCKRKIYIAKGTETPVNQAGYIVYDYGKYVE